MKLKAAPAVIPAARQPGQPWEFAELASYLKLSRKSLERAARLKTLKVIRFGRRVFVPDAEARRVAECGL